MSVSKVQITNDTGLGIDTKVLVPDSLLDLNKLLAIRRVVVEIDANNVVQTTIYCLGLEYLKTTSHKNEIMLGDKLVRVKTIIFDDDTKIDF